VPALAGPGAVSSHWLNYDIRGLSLQPSGERFCARRLALIAAELIMPSL